MTSKLRNIIGASTATAALTIALFGATAVTPQASPVLAPQKAQAGAASLIIRNGNTGGMELHACKNWGWSDGVWYATRCLENPTSSSAPNGPVKRLNPGSSTPSSEDWDGINVPKGYKLMRARFNRDGSKTYSHTERECVTSTKEWTKVQPTLIAGLTDWFRLVKC